VGNSAAAVSGGRGQGDQARVGSEGGVAGVVGGTGVGTDGGTGVGTGPATIGPGGSGLVTGTDGVEIGITGTGREGGYPTTTFPPSGPGGMYVTGIFPGPYPIGPLGDQGPGFNVTGAYPGRDWQPMRNQTTRNEIRASEQDWKPGRVFFRSIGNLDLCE